MAEHSLQEIHQERSRDGSHAMSVKWCRNCGAVVIDSVSDGRVRPGHFMAMQRPKMTQGSACAPFNQEANRHD